MDIVVRKPFQGVTNIIRFNWHFYVIAGLLIFLILLAARFASGSLSNWLIPSAALIIIPLLISLIVSCYVYDLSRFYSLDWMDQFQIKKSDTIININAGFDETSALLAKRYPDATLHVYDFYDPRLHTEVSIKRARKAYPPYPETICISSNSIPVENNTVDLSVNIFALHEIRNEAERINFLRCQYAALRTGGRGIIVEHLRDFPNFLAYTIGFMHFHSLTTWRRDFFEAGFSSVTRKKLNPFVTLFILTKHD